MQEKIVNWLRSIAGLETMEEEFVDDLPGCAGLFFKGSRTVSSTTDILGREIRRLRLRWVLVTNGDREPEIPLENVPVLGLLQTVSLENGHLTHLDEEQIPRWETELTVEFTVAPEDTEV